MNASNEELDALVDAWIRSQRELIEADAKRTHRAGDLTPDLTVSQLVSANPDAALRFVTRTLERTSDELVWSVLAAGPLEELLAAHGPHVIDRIEHLALENPSFRSLLFGVWRNLIDAATWERLERIRREH